MATVKIILDKRKAKSDGSYPIYFQICHNRKTTTRSTKIYVNEKDWDDSLKIIKRSNPLHKTLNLKLQKEFADLQSQILLANDVQVQQILKPELVPSQIPKLKKSVYVFGQELVNQLKADNKTGNAWVYEATINALKGFHPDEDLSFEQINFEFLTSYNSYLLKRNLSHNSIYLYIRTIRIFYNKAIKSKLVEKVYYPFDDYKLKQAKTRKRAVNCDIIKNIYLLDLKPGSTIWHCRNYFILSFCLIGISIVDLSLLKWSDLLDSRINYKRRKTGKWYNIKLQDIALQIIDYYRRESVYVLPIVDQNTQTDELLMRSIKSKTKLINKYLNRIANMLSDDLAITTYTSRHSWATMAKKAGFSIEIIAEALGHEYGNRTTAVYLDSFDQSVIDDMNQQVINLIK